MKPRGSQAWALLPFAPDAALAGARSALRGLEATWEACEVLQRALAASLAPAERREAMERFVAGGARVLGEVGA